MRNDRSIYEFSESVKQETLNRQQGRCASCGDSLNDSARVAHHIGITAQEARDFGLQHQPQYVKSVDNCAIVCSDCHEQFQHDGGRYRTAVEDTSALPYTHGQDTYQNQQMAMQHECARENAIASNSTEPALRTQTCREVQPLEQDPTQQTERHLTNQEL